MKLISIHELQSILTSGRRLDLIDVRTPAEFAGVHVPGARSVPLDNLDYGAVLGGARVGIMHQSTFGVTAGRARKRRQRNSRRPALKTAWLSTVERKLGPTQDCLSNAARTRSFRSTARYRLRSAALCLSACCFRNWSTMCGFGCRPL